MSTLSKHNVARFNEDYKEAKETAAKSQVKSIFSQKKEGQQGPKSQISQATRSIWSRTRGVAPAEAEIIQEPEPQLQEEQEVAEQLDQEELEQQEAEEIEVNADDKLTSVSQIKPTPTELSKMTGRTYISQLQKQLEEERVAREKLEGELNDLKKISSEIASHLSEIQKQ